MSESRETMDGIRSSLAVDLFVAEPALREVVINAIRTAEIPWTCSSELINEAREEAIRCVFSGRAPSNGLIDKLRLHEFDRKRDVEHALAKICAIGNSAVDRARWEKLGISKFTWQAIGKPLCEFDHEPLEGCVFSLTDGHYGAFPGGRYGCRCWGAAVIDF
jgi:uncharacterized protein with gpF-like domain